jgi:hypothetical protein
LLAAFTMALAATSARAEPPLSARVVSPLTQVFPSSVPPGEPEARLEAARGEWESFQIVVHATGAPARAVSAVASVLADAHDATVPAPRLFRVGYVTVATPSSIEGHPGPWPDPLIPDIDGFVGERRRAFPFDVPAGETRAIWVELFVPPTTAPGRYHGRVTVRADGGTPATVPLVLDVHAFTLPATSSLPVTFGMATGAIGKQHPGLSPAAAARLGERYEVAALRHRISIHGGTMEPAPWQTRAGEVTIDFARYDAEVGPFLDGKVDRGGPAEGARWTAIDLRVPSRLRGVERAQYVQQLVEHLRARGWLERAFDYTFDEPSEAQYGEVRRRAEALRAATPAVPRLVTRVFDERLHGAVDIWCPVVNFVDDKPGNSRSPARAVYHAHGAHGERIWWYQACMSHGCNIVGGDYFTGWPSYVIDAPAISHRIFEWLTFRYRIGGELYYNTVEAYARGLDPWRNQYLFGGNGDGTLFYPGRPDVIGGATDIPVASIRLALIRDGLEDYEYLRLYARAAGQAQAEALAATIANKTYRWEHDPSLLMAARHRMAKAIDDAVASGGGIGITAR